MDPQAVFDDDYDRLLELKAEFDPNNVIVSSPLLPGFDQRE